MPQIKRGIIFLVVVSGVFVAQAAYISEISYDPLGSDSPHEWIEVYNDTNSAINFTSWKFSESNTNHGITSFSGGASVSPGEYAVIADNAGQFLLDYPTYQGVLYDSSFSLSNSGEQIILKDFSLNAIDTVTYNTTLGGNNDGSTLSRIDGTWARGAATPGLTNQSSPLTSTTTTPTGGASTSTDNQITIPQMSAPSPDIVFYMPFEKTLVAGADSELNTYALTRAGKEIDNIIYTWAFGDGGQGTGSSTIYRYAYPGRYIAFVEGRSSSVIGVGHMIVKVVMPDITIPTVGVGKYGSFVDVSNPNNYDLDLSQWKLTINGAQFPFPKNTIILGGSTTRFSGVAMGFASTTVGTSTEVKIMFPSQEIVTSYHAPEIFEQSQVLGISTTTITAVHKTAVNKTELSKLPKVTTATSAIIFSTSTATTTIELLSGHTKKDTRIVAWFKSFFHH